MASGHATRSQVLRKSIGYLRIPIMGNRGALREIKTQMDRFRDTSGLIVDVRDNGGGSRHALRLVFSYLCKPDDAPRVINAAAYRLHATHAKDHLGARFMYREEADAWSKAEQAAIARFARRFGRNGNCPTASSAAGTTWCSAAWTTRRFTTTPNR